MQYNTGPAELGIEALEQCDRKDTLFECDIVRDALGHEELVKRQSMVSFRSAMPPCGCAAWWLRARLEGAGFRRCWRECGTGYSAAAKRH